MTSVPTHLMRSKLIALCETLCKRYLWGAFGVLHVSRMVHGVWSRDNKVFQGWYLSRFQSVAPFFSFGGGSRGNIVFDVGFWGVESLRTGGDITPDGY